MSPWKLLFCIISIHAPLIRGLVDSWPHDKFLSFEAQCTVTNNSTPCLVTCMRGPSVSLHVEIMKQISLHPQCSKYPATSKPRIHLIIANQIHFNQTHVATGWLRSAQFTVSTLTWDTYGITQIADGAFNSTVFHPLTNMTINNLRDAVFTPQIFAGLQQLVFLRLMHTTYLQLPAELLLPIASTLRYLQIKGEASRAGIPFDMIRLTGNPAASLTSLRYIKLTVPLRSSLTGRTFAGIPGARCLDLSHCEIAAIGPHTFEPVRQELRQLDLRGNNLHTLPVGLFKYLVPSTGLSILLANNPWRCDCDLVDLQRHLRAHAENFALNLSQQAAESPSCAEPGVLRTRHVAAAGFCGTVDMNDVQPRLTMQRIACMQRPSVVDVLELSRWIRLKLRWSAVRILNVQIRWWDRLELEFGVLVHSGGMRVGWAEPVIRPLDAGKSVFDVDLRGDNQSVPYVVCVLLQSDMRPLHCITMAVLERTSGRNVWLQHDQFAVGFLVGCVIILIGFSSGTVLGMVLVNRVI